VSDLRNPFRLQAAEHIDSETDFLRLFGHGVLDLLPEDAAFSRPQFIRSAPGGGKTSLLTLFTPTVLRTLLSLRTHPDYRDIFQRLKRLDAIDESGLRVVGIMLTCGRTFPDLADLGLQAARARRLLLALLDARAMIGALRSALIARDLRYPDDLQRVRLVISEDARLPGLVTPCDGVAARRWAEQVEQSICDTIDSLADSGAAGPPGHESMLMLKVLDSGALLVDGAPPAQRWLLLLDDVQKLTPDQRAALRETLLEQRASTTVWVAERLEALSTDELLAAGALPGRDYADVINLEEAWRRNPKRFEAAVSVIAERRARVASDVAAGDAHVSSFAAVLDTSLDSPDWSSRVEEAIGTVHARIRAIVTRDPKYAAWLRSREVLDGTAREKLVAWRTLEILIERHRRKQQQSFEFELGQEELDDKDDSGVRAAAELFISQEFGLPYFFGPSRLAQLGSFNVEQYLQLAGDLFEEALAQSLLRQRPTLSPERQHAILRGAYEARVKDLPRRAKNGRDVLNFITSVGKFCREVTFQPNAPYAPGVNGVAISMQEREVLLDAKRTSNSPYVRFADMLGTALAQNLLHAELDKSVKNQRWMILYLNRLMCLEYELPPHFGGFRERPLRELITWVERGYRPSRSDSLVGRVQA
jgi:hypothetical protein